ncbi:MAG: DUF1501 domain-containing protein [Bryobacteraceae bacterium]
MKETTSISRRGLLRLATGAAAPLAGFARFGMMNAFAQPANDYKALVCVFLFGGNDGHNLLIPQATAQFNAYKSARGTLALPDTNTKLMPVTAKNGTPYALNDGFSSIQPLWAQGRLAAVANVGNIVQPTSRTQYLSGAPVPTNLFSHSDQVLQMQTATPGGSGGTGWAGRVSDQVQNLNGAATFPASVSLSGQQIFCSGNVVQSASLIPGYDMLPYGMNIWPATAGTARLQSLQSILTMDSGLAMVQKANKVRQDALDLSAMLASAASGTPLQTVFPGTSIGNQLKQVAQILQLRNTLGMKRQVFFCSLGGFDTHGSQSWQQWDLFKQVGAAMLSFYQATQELGIADKVTTFLESEFGRTLQPSGTGSDHGWGNHFLVLGGAVNGGDVYGKFPDLSLGGPDDTGSRGALLPSTALDQYGATMAQWFGVPDASLDAVFPSLKNFSVRNLGFV